MVTGGLIVCVCVWRHPKNSTPVSHTHEPEGKISLIYCPIYPNSQNPYYFNVSFRFHSMCLGQIKYCLSILFLLSKAMFQNSDEQRNGGTLQEEENLEDIDLTDPELNKAATKIQASFRGHKARKQLNEDEETVETT